MTSHLESMRHFSGERVIQLTEAHKRMRDAPNNQTVLFGGDLNLRDREVCH